ncbi:MAG: hypothetical protein FJW30_06250 [Acidobacteria bacterium]|nr:hypothetical protein [Acidobacteriota bacterium]
MRTLTLLTLSTALMAQPDPKRGRAILEQALEAMGGAKFMAMQTRTEAGRMYTFYREQLSGLAHARLHTLYTDKFQVERQSIGKDKEDYAYLLSEDEAFTVNYRGIRPFPKAQHDRYRESTLRNIFFILRKRMNEPGLIVEFKETAVFDNNPVEIVEITDTENRSVSIYFNRTTHLPIRQIFKHRDPDTRMLYDESTVFNKYRDHNGVKWPWSIVRYRNGDRIFELYSESVIINNDKLDRALFAPPTGAKRLSND